MFRNRITELPRSAKQFVLIVSDSFFLVSAVYISFSLRLGYLYPSPGLIDNKLSLLIIFTPIIAIPIFIFFGLYRSIIRYIGVKAAWSVIKAVSLYSIIWGLISLLIGIPGFPRSVVFINFMVCLVFLGG